MTLPPESEPRDRSDDTTASSDRPFGAAAPTEVIRSEERLEVRRRLRPTRRLRLHKRVVTEEVTHTVTVRREELVIDAEDLTGTEPTADVGAGEGYDFGDTQHEIVLHEERVVTSTRVVPVERVRVRVYAVAEEVALDEVLRREEVEVETTPVTEIDPIRND